MDYRGPDLKADVYDIWETAVKNFPEMASAYLSANIAVHLTYTNSSGFDAKFLANWRKLRDELELIFGQDALTLNDTATALCEAITAYAKQDGAASDALNDATKELPNSVPGMGSQLYPEQFAPHGYANAAPPRPDYSYSGSGPTLDELLEKAQKVDDKLYEAACAEASGLDAIVNILPRDWTEGGDGYVFIVDKIKDVAKDKPSSYQGAIGSLKGVTKPDQGHPFSAFNSHIEAVKHALNPDKWDGDAAHNFKKNMLDAYPDVVATQVPVVLTLTTAVEKYQEALEAAYASYSKVMDEAINACNAIINEEAAKSDGVALAAMGAVISTGATYLTGGGTLAIGLSLAGNGISIASASIDVGEVAWDGEQDVPVDTRTGLVAHNCRLALDKAYEHLKGFDDELASSLGKDYETVSGGRSDPDKRLQLPRPGFADDPSKL